MPILEAKTRAAIQSHIDLLLSHPGKRANLRLFKLNAFGIEPTLSAKLCYIAGTLDGVVSTQIRLHHDRHPTYQELLEANAILIRHVQEIKGAFMNAHIHKL